MTTSTEYTRRLNDMTTEHLIVQQHDWPVAAVAAELERRGVTLWHHALTRGTR